MCEVASDSKRCGYKVALIAELETMKKKGLYPQPSGEGAGKKGGEEEGVGSFSWENPSGLWGGDEMIIEDF